MVKQGKLAFSAAPQDYRAVSFLKLWNSSVHIQHSAMKNALNVLTFPA